MDLQSHYPWIEGLTDNNLLVNDWDGEIVEGIAIERGNIPPPLLSLSEVLTAFGTFPPYSLIFGVCEDGLPLMLNLNDPRPGSILIEGEHRSGKTQVLRTLLASAATLNPVDRLAFCVITPNPDEMADLHRFPHCQASAAPYDRRSSEIILELSALAEQRRFGREFGPALILAIDDLGALLGDHLDYETYLNLRWLIAMGPGSQIWTVATLPYPKQASTDRQITSLFPTRILNAKARNSNDPKCLGDQAALLSTKNKIGFSTRLNRKTVRFIPLTI